MKRSFRHRLFVPVAAALLLTGYAAGPLRADDGANAAAPADPYDALYDAIQGAANPEQSIDNAIETLKKAFVSQSPDMAAAEGLYLGLMDRIGGAMRPYMLQHSLNTTALYKPRYIALFKAELTPDEAARLATFYRKPAMQRLLTTMVEHTDYNAMLGDIGTYDQPAQLSEVTRDVEGATNRSIATMTRSEIEEMSALNRSDPRLLQKLAALKPNILKLRTELENAPMDPKLETDFAAAIDKAIDDHFAAGDAAQPTP